MEVITDRGKFKFPIIGDRNVSADSIGFSLPQVSCCINCSILLITEKIAKSFLRWNCIKPLVTVKMFKSLLRRNCSIPLVIEKMNKSLHR